MILAERPEVEARKDQIAHELASDAKASKELEEGILKKLAEATSE